MDLKYILQRVPGVNRRFVYYLESQGYIQPTHLQKERIARRDYSENDLRIVQDTWKYYRQGFSLQAAYQLGVKQQHIYSYVFFQVPPRRRREMMDRLQELPELVEASVVYADNVDFIVKASTPQEADVYHAIVPLFAETGVTGLPKLMQVQNRFVRTKQRTRKRSKPKMMAYVMLKVPGRNIDDFMATLRSWEEVVEACTVYGESDVIVRVLVPSQEALDDLVMRRMHSIEQVESTRTYLVISNMYWTRDDAG